MLVSHRKDVVARRCDGSGKVLIAFKRRGSHSFAVACDVFLSYQRADVAFACLIARGLEAEGFTVWWDGKLHAGEPYDSIIEDRLRQAAAIVVLWSPRSIKSHWVRAEATYGQGRGVLAPVLVERCQPPVAFALLHAVDLTEWWGDRRNGRWRTLVRRVRDLKNAPSIFTQWAAADGAPEADVRARLVHRAPPRFMALSATAILMLAAFATIGL